ncbi:MAG: hypothetical protein COX70_09065 [Flavobacteriales bacterium CG_4_10_14_0_2_um_filter_32_8]|nr:MAG: hypothetical protein AUJ97_06810 [Bacteroidetes bacterium CG2_30_32_10]PJA06658.1 MAG: hypothetical protein COX70_09065 [Flavobacteriales bacterium CG_4_10_14_0_2_um_filter_32_8]PJB13896.1 MAG: hypothetical protein CO118_11435 [Flavobacteriales bacterium CG_4_9_14_3_um_filter_32_8]
MKISILFLFLFFLLFNLSSRANNSVGLSINENQVIVSIQENNLADTIAGAAIVTVKFKRGKAILFTVFTGFLGGHRIYLGTHQRTPIIYSVTLGGLGILPLIDLIQIIFTKDLSKFEYRPQIIMWGK